MIEIDGAEGGGQLLRTALALAAVTGEPFRMTDVRRRRPNPGLAPQHVAAVDLAARLCDARTEGARLESETLTFHPGHPRGEDIRADIGTAGAVTLLFDTVLPVASALDVPLSVTATGGTDVAWAPTVGYYEYVKLPLLAMVGLDARLHVARTGYYPAGGGEATLTVSPGPFVPFELTERGAFEGIEIRSKASTSLAERNVAERQADAARTMLDAAGMPTGTPAVEYGETRSPGSGVLVTGRYGRTRAGFSALGELGKPAERVGREAASRFLAFHAGPGAIDQHMADQMLVPLALAGGAVRIPTVTAHVETNLAVIRRFDYELSLDRDPDGSALVSAPVP